MAPTTVVGLVLTLLADVGVADAVADVEITALNTNILLIESLRKPMKIREQLYFDWYYTHSPIESNQWSSKEFDYVRLILSKIIDFHSIVQILNIWLN